MDVSYLAYVVPALLALIILVDVSVLWLTGKQVPELLSQLVVAVFATYFASGLVRSKGVGSVGRRSSGMETPGVSGTSGTDETH
jgi:hypothetical protein